MISNRFQSLLDTTGQTTQSALAFLGVKTVAEAECRLLEIETQGCARTGAPRAPQVCCPTPRDHALTQLKVVQSSVGVFQAPPVFTGGGGGRDPWVLTMDGVVTGADLFALDLTHRQAAHDAAQSDDAWKRLAIKLPVDTKALANELLASNGRITLLFTDRWLRENGILDAQDNTNNAVVDLRQFMGAAGGRTMSIKQAKERSSASTISAMNYGGPTGRAERINITAPFVVIGDPAELGPIHQLFVKAPDRRPPEAHPETFEHRLEQGLVKVTGDAEPFARMVLHNWAQTGTVSTPTQASTSSAVPGALQGEVSAKPGEPIIIQLTDHANQLTTFGRSGGAVHPTEPTLAKIMTFVAGSTDEPVYVSHPRFGEMPGPPRLAIDRLQIAGSAIIADRGISPGYLVEIHNPNSEGGPKTFKSAANGEGSFSHDADLRLGDIFSVTVRHPIDQSLSTTGFFQVIDDKLGCRLAPLKDKGDWSRLTNMKGPVDEATQIDKIRSATPPNLPVGPVRLAGIEGGATLKIKMEIDQAIGGGAQLGGSARAKLNHETGEIEVTLHAHRQGGWAEGGTTKLDSGLWFSDSASQDFFRDPHRMNGRSFKMTVRDADGKEVGQATIKGTLKRHTSWSYPIQYTIVPAHQNPGTAHHSTTLEYEVTRAA